MLSEVGASLGGIGLEIIGAEERSRVLHVECMLQSPFPLQGKNGSKGEAWYPERANFQALQVRWELPWVVEA